MPPPDSTSPPPRKWLSTRSRCHHWKNSASDTGRTEHPRSSAEVFARPSPHGPPRGPCSISFGHD
jgi:hypothetical protein